MHFDLVAKFAKSIDLVKFDLWSRSLPVDQSLHHLHRRVVVDRLLEAALVFEAVNLGGLFVGVANVSDVPAVREELTPDRERSERAGAVDVDDGLGVLRVGMSVEVLDAGHEVEGGVTDSSGISKNKN